MEFSTYNIYSKGNSKTAVFNTFTSAFVRIDNEKLNSLLSDEHSDIAKQLLDMGILVNSKSEEIQKYKYIQHTKMFRNDSITLYICPTMNCNFSCSYCFEGGNKGKGNMTEDVENAIVLFLSQNKNKKISIIWFGGEPLINANTIGSIAQKLNDENINYTSSMITNGSLLTKRAIGILKNIPIEFIQISMDGTKEIHDSRRHFRSGIGSFDIIMNGIDRLLFETTIPITVQVAIDKTNLQEYENLLSYFNAKYPTQMKEKRVQLNYNIVKDRTNFDIKGTCLNHQEHFNYLLNVNQLNLDNKASFSLPNIAPPCMYNTIGSYAIAPNGDVFKCIEQIGDKSKAIGNIVQKELSLAKMASCFYEKHYLENQECLNCSILPVCGGGCPLDRQADNGKNNVACSFYKKHLTHIISNLSL